MPEGHVIHRQARDLYAAFARQRLEISSPQGRFAAGAQKLDGATLVAARAHGKHLFLGFRDCSSSALPAVPVLPETAGREPVRESGDLMSGWDQASDWLHVHLGLYGKWRWHEFDSVPPSPVGQVRVRLVGDSRVADLSGPNRCELIDGEQAQGVIDRLGPDPLDPQPGDRERFVTAVRARARAVGELVMDQSVVAGPGNIYRAECLFHVGISPFRAGMKVSRGRLESLWDDLAVNLERGREEGVIVTISDTDKPYPPVEGDEESQRFYVYHRGGRACLRCGARVGEQLMAGRRLFWCPGCQR